MWVRPTVLLVAGWALALVGWSVVTLAVVGVGFHLYDEGANTPDWAALVDDDVTTLPARVELDLDDEDYVVVGFGDGLAAMAEGEASPTTIRITTVDGDEVPLDGSSVEVLDETPSGDSVALTSFTLDEPTRVVISAEGTDGGVRTIGVAPAWSLESQMSDVPIIAGVGIAGALAGFGGVVLVVGGSIDLVAASRKAALRPGPHLSGSGGWMTP